jgi:hypothetical protein
MARKKVKPEFDADYDPDADSVPGGGIPDDDGMVYLRRNSGTEQANGKVQGKAGRGIKAKGKPVEDRPG